MRNTGIWVLLARIQYYLKESLIAKALYKIKWLLTAV